MASGHGRLTDDDTTSRRFAEAVLGHTPADPDDAAARLFAIHERLAGALSPIIGEHGFEAMFAASIRATGFAHPALASVVVADANAPGDSFWGALRALDAARAAPIELISLTTFFELLADFIGDVLALRILHEAWPSVPLADAAARQSTP